MSATVDSCNRQRDSLVRPFTAQTLLRVVLWLILVAGASYTRVDPDLWGHVRFGLDILRDASVPQADSYSFSSDRTWINHEWAAEVVTASAFRLGGGSGLVLLKLSAIGGVLLLLVSVLRREGVDSVMMRDALAALAVITTIEQTHHVRPQLFSVIAFAALLWCLLAARHGSQRWLGWLLPLFALWANLHGGWTVGGGVLLIWTVGLAWAEVFRQASWCAAAGVLSLAATLMTPYGIGLWQFLHDTIGFGRADITEWQPVWALGWMAWVRWCVPLALAVLAVRPTPRSNVGVERIAVVLVLGAASLFVARLLAFFALAVLFLLGRALDSAYQRARESRPVVPARTSPWLVPAAIAAAVLAMVITSANLTHLWIDSRHTPEPEAIALLRAQPAPRRLLVWFDWGEYAIWYLSPAMRVSIDGRRETVYSDALQDRHLRFYFDAPGGASLPRELAADYVWIPRVLPAAQRLELDTTWLRIFAGEQSVIFARRGLAAAAPIIAVARNNSGVFPGP